MAISLTPAAADHVARFLANRGKGLGVRLGVRTSGCSGMAYVLEFADTLEPEDQVFEAQGVKVIVDPKSLALSGWDRTRFRPGRAERGLQIQQPERKDACGCGESFNV